MKKQLCELFAGVGGFRLGLDRLDSGWKTVWFSQWEPGASKQWAHDCYVSHFGDIKDLHLLRAFRVKKVCSGGKYMKY